MLKICAEIVGFCYVVGIFIVVDMHCGKCGWIYVYSPAQQTSWIAFGIVGLYGYWFGGVIIEVDGSDFIIWGRLYGNDRNDQRFAGNI